jgi:hypothetical protein
MTPSTMAVETRKRLRGAILELVVQGHQEQRTRMNDLVLWGVLQKLHYDVSQNDVITFLQDLGDRQYLTFKEDKNRKTGELRISLIQCTPKGRDLVEGNVSEDPAVNILR